MENNVKTWTKSSFFSSGKILLLRMCNDLLRCLSSSQNPVFHQWIQLFLARLFPLLEKSALNFMSHFNFKNVTTYSKRVSRGTKPPKTFNTGKGDKEEAMELEEEPLVTNSDAPIDYHQPTLCFNPEQWKLVHGLRYGSSSKINTVKRHKTLTCLEEMCCLQW